MKAACYKIELLIKCWSDTFNAYSSDQILLKVRATSLANGLRIFSLPYLILNNNNSPHPFEKFTKSTKPEVQEFLLHYFVKEFFFFNV